MKERIDKDYWEEEYYKFWDDFVVEWFNQRKQGFKSPQDEDSQSFFNAVKGLVFDELPNPYFGDPKNGVDAVIINLNPGGSEKDKDKKSTDATQFYSNLEKTDEHGNCIGWLMKKFVDNAKCSYKRFVGNDDDDKSVNWSQLNPKLRWHETEVCGVKWWQGLLKNEKDGEELYSYEGKTKTRKVIHSSKQRIEWMRRIYNNPWLDPAKIFALELCPFHSPGFSFKKGFSLKKGETFLNFIHKHVIIPAATAVVENKLPFAVAVGKTTADILDTGIGTFQGEWPYEGQPKDWPTNDGRQRKYRLYDVKVQNDRIAHIVVTWAAYNIGIPSPELRFAAFERGIYELCRSSGNFVGGHNCDSMICRPEDVSKQAEPQQSKPASPHNQGRKQLYKNLWSGFSEWCKDNKRAWFTKEVNCEANYIEPADKGKSFCLLFNVRGIAPLKGKLCLGMRCDTLNIWGEIKKTCKKGFEDINADMWWGDEQSSTSRTILFPVAEDWRNPNEALFNKMATTFESVRDVLRDKGFL